MRTVACKVCGVEFHTSNGNAKYCSGLCYSEKERARKADPEYRMRKSQALRIKIATDPKYRQSVIEQQRALRKNPDNIERYRGYSAKQMASEKRKRWLEARREKYATDHEWREREREKNRARYKNDPAFRERCKVRNRKYFVKDSKRSEARKEYALAWRIKSPKYQEHLERLRQRRMTDPEFRKEQCEASKKRYRKLMAAMNAIKQLGYITEGDLVL